MKLINLSSQEKVIYYLTLLLTFTFKDIKYGFIILINWNVKKTMNIYSLARKKYYNYLLKFTNLRIFSSFSKFFFSKRL